MEKIALKKPRSGWTAMLRAMNVDETIGFTEDDRETLNGIIQRMKREGYTPRFQLKDGTCRRIV